MRLGRLILAMMGTTALLLSLSQPAEVQDHRTDGNLLKSGVFVLGNDPEVNTVLTFELMGGELSQIGTFATGGKGGAGGNQGGLALDQNRGILVAVNAGSDTVTLFDVRRRFLDWQGIFPAHGSGPMSAAVCTPSGRHRRPLVYVLNETSRTIAGFSHEGESGLEFIEGSVQSLSENTSAAAQILFDNTCNLVIVVERNADSFMVYEIDDDGIAAPGVNVPSLSAGQLGSALTLGNQLFVSETGASAASSFNLDLTTPNLSPISQTIMNGQAGSCWAVATHRTFRCDDRRRDCTIGYVMNAGTANITSYTVQPNGKLTLREMIAQDTLGGAFDGALAGKDRFLVVQSHPTPNEGALNLYEILQDGSLEFVQVLEGLPASTNSVAAMN